MYKPQLPVFQLAFGAKRKVLNLPLRALVSISARALLGAFQHFSFRVCLETLADMLTSEGVSLSVLKC